MTYETELTTRSDWLAAAQVYATLSAGYRTAQHMLHVTGVRLDMETAAQGHEQKAIACLKAAGVSP